MLPPRPAMIGRFDGTRPQPLPTPSSHLHEAPSLSLRGFLLRPPGFPLSFPPRRCLCSLPLLLLQLCLCMSL